MKKENLFFVLVVLTILIVRIFLLIFPKANVEFSGVEIHHYWFGIVFLLLAIIITTKKENLKITISGIGTGLIIDQLMFIILGAGQDQEYWALPSLIGIVFFTGLIYPVRRKIIKLIDKDKL